MKLIDEILNKIQEQETPKSENPSQKSSKNPLQSNLRSAKGLTTTDGEMPHHHEFEIDEEGNGLTRSTLGEGPDHTHEIEEFTVDPGGVDNHYHKILEKPLELFPPLEDSKKQESVSSTRSKSIKRKKINWDKLSKKPGSVGVNGEDVSEDKKTSYTSGGKVTRKSINWSKLKR